MEEAEDYEFEVEDDALIRHEEEYKRVSAILLETINQRAEYIRLLKTVKPDKIALIREGISLTDDSIEAAENYLVTLEDLIQKRKSYLDSMKEAWIMSEKLFKGMREHFADDPEKLAQLEALIEDDGKSH